QRGHRLNATPASVPWLPSMNLIVRRDAFLAVEGFNEHLETAEDVDLCYRLGKRGIILYNPAMEATHWGEAKNVCIFWRKEAWRGRGNLRGLFSHGFRWDELPSLGYPLYTLCAILLIAGGSVLDLWLKQFVFVSMALIMFILPASVLAANTGYRAKS